MVFQSYALFPTMTVYQNIAFSLTIQKKSKFEIDRIVRDTAKKVDLTDEQLIKNVTELSGGQQQRVAIARALASNPPILCLDEPLSNLDAKLRVQLRQELKQLQKKLGITMIYVTHDQEEALTLSDHICVFKKGEVDQVGTPNEIYNHSKTEYTCNFIGDINKLSKEFITELNNSNMKCSIDLNKNSYIRLEKIRINNHKENYYTVKAIIDSIEYYGMYVKCYVKYKNDLFKVIKLNDEQKLLNTGDEVSLSISVNDILSFTPDLNEEPQEKIVTIKKSTILSKVKEKIITNNKSKESANK